MDNLITLQQLKEHLMIEHDVDDAYLQSLIPIAQEAVLQNANLGVDEFVDVPVPLIQAILLLAGTLYNNRESVSYGAPTPVPHTYDYLISLFQNYSDVQSR